eukprot:TRINITY_DN71502_c0_g1_i1.p1 TRINITY_DN71502_c0_g1~~TRINITY_DN71502_c0_g1_i1.p1  ORF type:complete len:352 (+),score=33.38 TRINITY_DN71502_c0_g1_i1:97-1152(+)
MMNLLKRKFLYSLIPAAGFGRPLLLKDMRVSARCFSNVNQLPVKHIKDAIGLCIFTDILHKVEGTITKIPRKDNNFLVTYSDSSKQILKTHCFAEEDKISIAREKALYAAAAKVGEKTSHIPKPICIKERKDAGNLYIEMLFEWTGESLFAHGPPGPKSILEWAKQSVAGQKAGVETRVPHLGIKPGTLGWYKGLLKISDIVHPEDLGNTKELIKTTISPYIKGEKFCYFPPELLGGREYDNEKVDVYCWGMHFYRITTGKGIMEIWQECEKYKMGKEENYKDFMQILDGIKIKNGQALQDQFIPILKAALSFESTNRPTFKSLDTLISAIKLSQQNILPLHMTIDTTLII